MPAFKTTEPWTPEQHKQFVLIVADANRALASFAEPLKQLVEPLYQFRERYKLSIQAIQESARKAESFAPPAGLIEALREMGEKAKMAQTLISSTLPKVSLDYYSPKPETVVWPNIPRSEHLLEYQNQLLEELIEKQEAKTQSRIYEYYPETKTFITRVVVHGAINFSTKGRTDSISTLFEVFYEILEERGEIENGHKIVFATADEIIQRAIKKNQKYADINWLKHTRSNLISKIPQALKEIVTISGYDRQRKGYYFKVRVGEYMTN